MDRAVFLKPFALALAASCLVVAGCAAGVKPFGSGDPAPSFRLHDLQGREVTLEALRGRVVLLNFWATWCGPCLYEIPDLIAVDRAFDDGQAVVVGISVDAAGPEAVKAFAEKMGMTYPVLLADRQVIDAYRINPIPASFLIDRQGILRGKMLGPRPKAFFIGAIQNVLKETQHDAP